jgi:hypothetical protein
MGFYLVKWYFAGACFLLAIYTVLTLAPLLETAVFPVVGKLHFISHTENTVDGVTTTTLYVDFNKKRACEYVGITWSHVLPDGSLERVPLVTRTAGDTSSPTRPTGETIAGPWKIPLPWAEIEGHSVVKLFHRCNPLWVTTTDFYP